MSYRTPGERDLYDDTEPVVKLTLSEKFGATMDSFKDWLKNIPWIFALLICGVLSAIFLSAACALLYLAYLVLLGLFMTVPTVMTVLIVSIVTFIVLMFLGGMSYLIFVEH
jgi:hypothetical protein